MKVDQIGLKLEAFAFRFLTIASSFWFLALFSQIDFSFGFSFQFWVSFQALSNRIDNQKFRLIFFRKIQ